MNPLRDSLNAVILRPAVGRRTSRNASDLIVASRLFGQGFWGKSRDRAIKPEAFREILRQHKAQDDSGRKESGRLEIQSHSTPERVRNEC